MTRQFSLVAVLVAASFHTVDGEEPVTRYVCAAGDARCGGMPAYTTIQAAVDAARAGDTVCIKADETFTGDPVFTLPDKGALRRPVTIQGCVDPGSMPPPGHRIGPEHESLLPTLVNNRNNGIAVTTSGPARDYVIRWLRFEPDPRSTQHVFRLGRNDHEQQFAGQQPRNITIDQIVIDGHPMRGLRMGVMLHGANLNVLNSRITNAFGAGQDTACIGVVNGLGPHTIHNNYCEGGTYSFITGGDRPQMHTTAVVAASPAPTTTVFALTNFRPGHTADTLEVGERVAVQTGPARREHPSVTAIDGNRVTVSPPLSSAPLAGYDVRWGASPADILIERNHFFKPPSWRDPILHAPGTIDATADTSAGTLRPGTYTYRVQALMTGGYGNLTYYSLPTRNVQITLTATGRVRLTWPAVPHATSYRVYGRKAGETAMHWSTRDTTFTDHGRPGAKGSPPAATRRVVKNNGELKVGVRVTIRANVFDGSWQQAGDGMLLWIKNVNQRVGGRWPGAYIRTEDVLIEYNVMRRGAGCMKFNSSENEASGADRRLWDPPPMERVTVRHNLCYDIGEPYSRSPSATATFNTAVGQTGSPMRAWTFENNTFLGTRTAIALANRRLGAPAVIRSNAFRSTPYGIKADAVAEGSRSLAAANVSTFTHNILPDSRGSSYPDGNHHPSQQVFENALVNWGGPDILDYAWVAGSPYANGSHTGGPVGVDVHRLAAMVEGVVDGTPTDEADLDNRTGTSW
jgi:hypothetical protein